MKRMLFALLAICTSLAALTPASAQVVPAEDWARLDAVDSLDMSPNGERIAMLMRRQPNANPELLLFETGNITETMQALETELRPVSLFWANDRHLVVTFLLETEFRNQPVLLSRLASYDTERNSWTSLLRVPGSTTRNRNENAQAVLGRGFIASRLPDDPDHVLVGHTEEFGDSPNFYRTNVSNGRRQLVLPGTPRFGDIYFDRNGEARGATEYDAARNRVVVYARPGSGETWQEIGALNADDRYRFDLLGFYHPDNPNIATIRADEPGVNTLGIYSVDISTGARELLFRSERYDADGVVISPRASDGSTIIGYTYLDEEGSQRYFVDEEFGSLYAGLDAAFPGKRVSVIRQSEDGDTTLFYVTGPQDSGSWYLLRDGAAARILGRNPHIPGEALSASQVIEYDARDGRALSGYVTIPNGQGPFPAIAMPHGGPWVRDTLGYDEWAQMLANRGYAVFQPNYRGSTGLGREHWVAGDQKWGLEMQDDVDDGMMALVEAGIADPDRLGFFGWSYGGYSAFVAATREAPIYNCAAAGAGLTDLTRVRGGLTGNRFLREFQRPTIDGVSPLERVEDLSIPMLIVHGDRDNVAPVDHSRWFVDAAGSNADLEYIEISGMLHSPRSFDEYMAFYPALFEFFETRCGF